MALATAACHGSVAAERTGTRADAVIYDKDDRADVYAHADARMKDIALRASVALVEPMYIDERDPANIVPTPAAISLAEFQSLCSTEPYRADPSMASCSGALIDEDLVLTANHCVPTEEACRGQRFVFNFHRTSATELHRITSEDVFGCKERVAFQYTSEDPAAPLTHDFAIVRLDRKATPRFVPTAVRREGPLAVNGKIGIIGYGDGIPAKIDTGGTVTDPRASAQDYFLNTADAYSGNSGSPMFELMTYELAGILVRGEAEDYVDTGTCKVNHRCTADSPTSEGCTGMESDYAFQATKALCAKPVEAKRYPALCAKTACGNGRCEANETAASCAADCKPAAPAAPPASTGGKPSSKDEKAADEKPTPATSTKPPVDDPSCAMTNANANARATSRGPLLAFVALALGAALRRRRSLGSLRSR